MAAYVFCKMPGNYNDGIIGSLLPMCTIGVSLMRKTSPAANGTSATIKYTSHAQLAAMHSLLSPDLGSGTNAAFWDRFDVHICTPPVPYNSQKGVMDKRNEYAQKKGKRKTENDLHRITPSAA